jgi:hypothetical protein
MTERQNEGAGHGAENRGAMKWRLETLHRRTEEGVRELGARVLEMHHQGKVDPEAVREGAAKLDELEKSAAELEAAMRDETGPRPIRPSSPSSASRSRATARPPGDPPWSGR